MLVLFGQIDSILGKESLYASLSQYGGLVRSNASSSVVFVIRVRANAG